MIGAEIGNYRIVEKIGEGGMGVVYKAIETQLDRTVAIKALNPQFSANRELMERFRAEARAQAQMNHPNVATLYTFLVQDNVAYMVMEYVEGEAFDKMVERRGPIPVAEALPLFRQALRGIGYAHRLGIVHRDIKPSNIMVNREKIVKVMDFGLAKVMGDRSLTATGVRLGTVYYMSPEQILSRPADVRSDIYSLGATFYEILTARAPFQGDSDFHILNAHVNTPPPLPSSVCASIPPAVERAVLKALAKNPDERFQTAEGFAAALELTGDPVLPFAITAGAGEAPSRGEAVTEAITTMSVRPAPQPVTKANHRGMFAAGIIGVLAILLAGWLLLRPKTQPPAVPPATAATRPATPVPAAPTTPTPPPVTRAPSLITLPAGAIISVRLLEDVGAKVKNSGQEFQGEVAAPVMVGGRAALHTRDGARLRLEDAAASGRSKRHDMALRLISIESAGQRYAVASMPYVMKGGFLHRKRVAAGKTVDFGLTSPVTLREQP